MKKALLLTILFLLPILIFAAEKTKQIPRESDETIYSELNRFLDILMLVRKQYADPEKVTYRQLFRGAAKGMLRELDRFSAYEEPEQFKSTMERSKGSFAGIGATVTNRNGVFRIVSVNEKSPAEKAGLKQEDHIQEINGKKTAGLPLFECVKMLKGPVGTNVVLKVYRPSDDSSRTFTLKRARIEVTSVRNAGMIEKYAYFRVTQFTATTAADIDKFLKEHPKKEGIIIDLRNNPGGLLNSAVMTCSRFLEKGKLIVSIEGRNNSRNELKAVDCKKDLTTPVVILINRNSASAAEIFAACLKDHKRAILIGERSFGKGSVQSLVPLREGGGVRITTAKYFTQSRRPIHGHGVDPDIKIELTPGGTAAVAMHLTARGAHVPVPAKGRYRDEQLIRAIEILKGINILKNNQ